MHNNKSSFGLIDFASGSQDPSRSALKRHIGSREMATCSFYVVGLVIVNTSLLVDLIQSPFEKGSRHFVKTTKFCKDWHFYPPELNRAPRVFERM